jgi:hypothetical protein
MKKLIGIFLLIGMCIIGVQADAQAPKKIVGASGECETTNIGCQPIPLIVTTVCTSSCVLRTRPSFIDVNRMWGSSGVQCNTSVNGGATWSGCTTQPFNSGGKENYAGASDGSVIGTAQPVADCVIKRSIDNGTIWTTVYTGVGQQCDGAAIGSTQLTCLNDGSCTFVYRNPAASTYSVIRSTDNGQNWTTIFTSGTTTLSIQTFTLTNAGGVAPPVQSGRVGVTAVESAWATTSSWAAGSSCWGSFMLGASSFGVCYSGAGSIYEVRDANTGAIIVSPVLSGAVALINTGGVALGFGTSVIYMLAAWQPVSGSAPIGIYVSRDSGATFVLLGLSSINANSMREGDFWQHPLNGCLYFSAGSTPQFVKIC